MVHSFDVSVREARIIQNELRCRVELTDRIESPDEIELVGGADVAFLPCFPASSEDSAAFPGIVALAVVIVIDVKRCAVVETAFAAVHVRFPYIPGFLTFREGPAVLAALGELKTLPGVMIYDGAGIAHPRGLGIASHMALLTGIPSIGCAKSLLTGVCEEPGGEKGEWTYIYLNGQVSGTCLRTRNGVKPVYVSPGSGFSVDGARKFVLLLTGSYRLPEPTRIAHIMVTRKKQELIRKPL